MPRLSFRSCLGDLTISEEGGALVAIDWGWRSEQNPSPLVNEARQQIEDFLESRRRNFDLPLNPAGTDFQKRVYAAIQRIPFGALATYGCLARQVGSPRAARAVGRACGTNPIPIVIPCHRVVGAAGHIGGYSGDGGLVTKRWLLALER